MVNSIDHSVDGVCSFVMAMDLLQAHSSAKEDLIIQLKVPEKANMWTVI